MKRLLPAIIFILALASAPAVFAQSTFTYQGRLMDGNAAANGDYAMQFRLFDAAIDGQQIGTTQNAVVAIVDGLFTTKLDFGAGAFSGTGTRWLEIQVSSTPLAPRQEITVAPAAIRATNALQLGGIAADQYVLTTDTRLSNSRTPTGAAGGDLTGSYPNPGIAANAVTAAKIAGGNVVKSINGLKDNVTISGSSTITITPSGNTLTLSTPTALLRKVAVEINLTQPSNVNYSHNLGTTDLHVFVYKLINGLWENIPYGPGVLVMRNIDVNVVQVAIFSAGTFRIVVIG